MPFERAQHRDRRRDGAVAIEQRRTENADRDDAGTLAMLDPEQRHQRENATLAVVVGAHDDRDVFDRRGDDERPHDERQHAERDVGRGRPARPVERRLEGVEWARPDVAIDDAERAERHGGETAVGLRSGIRWLGRDRQRVLPMGKCDGPAHAGVPPILGEFSFRPIDEASRPFVVRRRLTHIRPASARSAGLRRRRSPGTLAVVAPARA